MNSPFPAAAPSSLSSPACTVAIRVLTRSGGGEAGWQICGRHHGEMLCSVGGFRGCDVSYTDWRGVVFRRGGKIRHRQMRWGSFRFRWLLLQEYERKGNKIGEIGSAGCREMQRRFVCDSCRVFWYFLLLWIVVVVSRSTWREAGFWCLKNQSFQKRPDRRAFHLTWCRWTGAR